MPKIAYEDWAPKPATIAIIETADQIATEYRRQGYSLTLRQLYYQFVSRDLIPNTQKSYDSLGTMINRGRLAGMIDWNHIEDRTRNLAGGDARTEEPSDVVRSFADYADVSHWDDQSRRIEVWVEKEALAGVVQRVAARNYVAYFSCRGYVSQSEMWNAAQRIGRYLKDGREVTILHLGDHDPSGIDMTRDITERLEGFIRTDLTRARYSWANALATAAKLDVNRIALNRDQIDTYQPPPNPAKVTDSRFENYREIHGDESWELDALDPATLDALIQENIDALLDPELWDAKDEQVEALRMQYRLVADNWDQIQTDYQED